MINFFQGRKAPAAVFWVVLISVYTPSVLAISNKELVTNCQELVNIYDKKGSKRLLAGVSTSVSEAMRAGICKGVLEEHASHSYCHGHWYDQALYIIENGEREDDLSVEQLLDNACAG